MNEAITVVKATTKAYFETGVRHPRPVQLYYYNSGKDATESYARKSRACTPHSACRAAFARVLEGPFAHVDIYGAGGNAIGFVRREKNGNITAVVDRSKKWEN